MVLSQIAFRGIFPILSSINVSATALISAQCRRGRQEVIQAELLCHFSLPCWEMPLLCLLMSPGDAVSDVLSRKSSSWSVYHGSAATAGFGQPGWLAQLHRYWMWPMGCIFSLNPLDLTHSSPSSWSQWAAGGCLKALVPAGNSAWLPEQLLQGCWSHAVCRYSSPAPHTFYPLQGSCCLFLSPLCFATGADLWAVPCTLCPCLSQGSQPQQCAEMQVIYLRPASLAW